MNHKQFKFGVTIVGVVFSFVTPSVYGDIMTYWAGGGNLWNVPDNWSPAMIPNLEDNVVPHIFGPGAPLVDSTQDAAAHRMYGPQNNGGSATNVMHMTGGTLTLRDWRFADNDSAGPGEFILSGGTVSIIRDHLHLGYRGNAILTMTGGTFNIANNLYQGENSYPTKGVLNISDGTLNISGYWAIGMRTEGNLYMTGGTLNIGQFISQCDLAYGTVKSEAVIDGGDITAQFLRVGRRGPGTWTMNGGTLTLSEHLVIGEDDDLGDGYFEFNGGTLTLGRPGITDLIINPNNGSRMNMTGSALMVIRGNAVDSVNDLVAAEKLKAYDGTGIICIRYLPHTNKTEVRAVPLLGPNPHDGAEGVAAGAEVLEWTLPAPVTPGALVTCDIRFGTSPIPSDMSVIVDHQAAESVPVLLSPNEVYYWQITTYEDGVQSVEGPVFVFDTIALPASAKYWIGGSAGDLWNAGANWNPVGLPASTDAIEIQSPPARGPVIDETVTAACDRIYGPGNGSAAGSNRMQITGGLLTILHGWKINDACAGPTGEVQMSGGTVNAPYVYVGYRGDSIVTMTGGIINVSDYLITAFASAAAGEVVMEDGEINATGVVIGESGYGRWIMNDGRLTLNEALIIGAGSVGTGYFELNGGTIIAGRPGFADLRINDNSKMNITGGHLRLAGNAANYVDALIESGKLRAYNGLGWFEVTYEPATDQTAVVAKTRSRAYYPVAADLNNDRQVDLGDFVLLADAWLQTPSEIPVSLVREGDLPLGHPFWPSPQLRIITGTDKHRSRGSGLVILPDKWLLFWREGAHHHDDPNSNVKMAESRDGGRTLENIKTLYRAAEHDGIEWLDIRARLMDNGRIGVYGGRRLADGDCQKPLFSYSDDEGQTWSFVSLDHFETVSGSPSFTFNRFPASVGGHDTEGYILFWRGGDGDVHIAYTVDNGLTWKDRRARHSGASAGEMSIVRLGETDRWIMIGRDHTYPNAVHTSTDLFNWKGPYYTDKRIGANPSTIVYNKGFVTWIAASRPYHYSNSSVHAQLVNGEILRGLVTCTVEAETLWKNPAYWPEWSVLQRLPVHFDGTFVEDEGRWYMIFGAVEGPPEMSGTTQKTYSRLGVMSAQTGDGQ